MTALITPPPTTTTSKHGERRTTKTGSGNNPQKQTKQFSAESCSTQQVFAKFTASLRDRSSAAKVAASSETPVGLPPHQLTERMFAHVVDEEGVIRGTSLECNVFSQSIAFCHGEIVQAASGRYPVTDEQGKKKLSKMQEEVASAHNLQGKFEALMLLPPREQKREHFQEIGQELATKVKGLEKGSRILIPGGWAGEPTKGGAGHKAGHALLYEVSRSNDGDLSFTVINSGAGLEYHSKVGQERQCAKTFMKLKEETLNKDFFSDLVRLRVEPYWGRPDGIKSGAPSLYDPTSGVLKALYQRNSGVVDSLQRPPQKASTCTWNCLTLWQEHHLKREEFQKLSLCTKVHTSLRFQEKFIEGKAPLERMTRDVAKHLLGQVAQRLQNEGFREASTAISENAKRTSESLALENTGSKSERMRELPSVEIAPPTLQHQQDPQIAWNVQEMRLIGDQLFYKVPSQTPGEYLYSPAPIDGPQGTSFWKKLRHAIWDMFIPKERSKKGRLEKNTSAIRPIDAKSAPKESSFVEKLRELWESFFRP